ARAGRLFRCVVSLELRLQERRYTLVLILSVDQEKMPPELGLRIVAPQFDLSDQKSRLNEFSGQ
nr:hypothetical protein [Tanacetum cinerariifolium]